MARIDRMEVLNRAYSLGVVPVIYDPDPETARHIVSACADAGARVVEFTNRGDFVPQVFFEVSQVLRGRAPGGHPGCRIHFRCPHGCALSRVGSQLCRGAHPQPGGGEALQQEEDCLLPWLRIRLGDLCRRGARGRNRQVFPRKRVGRSCLVKSVSGPMPWTRIMPTGGVEPTEASIRSWIEAGAACLGMGSSLITKDLVLKRDWKALTKRIATCLKTVKTVREPPGPPEAERRPLWHHPLRGEAVLSTSGSVQKKQDPEIIPGPALSTRVPVLIPPSAFRLPHFFFSLPVAESLPASRTSPCPLLCG
jgi:2-dehydro-3-deoxyphosphogluconate aldolase / (4S)-4-hydroxy-2-oxoglutarate aldolase